MKAYLRTTIILAMAAIFAAGFVAIYALNKNRRAQVTCSGVKVEFADKLGFVTQDDIEGYLQTDYGTCIGKRLDSLDLEKIENILEGKSAIMETEAYTTPDGVLHVRLCQREPVIRFQKGENGFYADSRGFLFPLNSGYTSRVPVIDGNIPLDIDSGYKGEPKTEKEKKWLSDVIALAGFMDSSGIWSENISQITVDPEGDLILVPRQGRERFIFGGPDGFVKKFRKIQEYYTAIVPARGKDTYSTVNVKYDKQIVCRK